MNCEICFVCGSPITTGEHTKLQSLLEKQLSAVFMLSKLLKIPKKSLDKCFQLSGGEDPASWITICGGHCQEVVDNAQTAYREMCRARQTLETCQKEIRKKIMSSSSAMSLLAGHKDYRAEILKTVREVVEKENDSETDDFAAVDQFADSQSDGPVADLELKLEAESPLESSEEMKHEDNWFDSDRTLSSNEIKDEPDLERKVITVKVKHRENPTSKSVRKRPKSTTKRKHEKCPQCDYFGQNLRRHAATVHPQDNHIYACNLCDKTFDSELRLKLHHKNCHRPKKTENCPHCDYTTDHKSHLKRHIRTRHETSRAFNCEICQAEFNLPENLRRHQVSNHNKCSLKDCGKVCESQEKLRDHQLNDHGKEVDVFKCDECEMLYKVKRLLKEHVITHHRKGDEGVFPCDQCDKTFLTQTRLQVHINNNHKTEGGKGNQWDRKGTGKNSNLILGI